MIFVTVGTDLPFNRMVKIVDDWAAENNRSDVFAQIGKTDWKPRHIQFTQFIDPSDFPARFRAADLIIAHAGMGTILSALRWGKPILVMPRKAALGEQRNEHQLATARRLLDLGKISVAFDETSLIKYLESLEIITSTGSTGPFADSSLTSAIHQYIHTPESLNQ